MSERLLTELRALLKTALEVTNEIGAGEGSRPSSPVAPDGPEVLRCPECGAALELGHDCLAAVAALPGAAE